MSDATCGWCAKPSEYLCDTLLLPRGAVAGSKVESVAEYETCDSEMCPEHATVTLRGCGAFDPMKSAECRVVTGSGKPCSRITGGPPCWQHAGAEQVPYEQGGFEAHCCPYCASTAERLSVAAPSDAHRKAARAHGGRSQMRLV